jgi:hypothetical protein
VTLDSAGMLIRGRRHSRVAIVEWVGLAPVHPSTLDEALVAIKRAQFAPKLRTTGVDVH